ncbi:Vacuolar protein sorting-associated protein 72 -like protein, partial [Trichinella pseudospiralis]
LIMASSRPKRCTAGNRMQELLATLPPTDEFFSSTYGGFTEEKDDTDYKYVDEGKDEFDSDFGSTSDEESDAQQDADEDDDEDLDEERKKKKFEFRRHLHLSSLQKKAQPSAAPTEINSCVIQLYGNQNYRQNVVKKLPNPQSNVKKESLIINH